MRLPCQGISPPVTIWTAVPVFSPPPATMFHHQEMRAPPVRAAPPVSTRQAVPVYTAPPIRRYVPAPICKGRTDAEAENIKTDAKIEPTVIPPARKIQLTTVSFWVAGLQLNS